MADFLTAIKTVGKQKDQKSEPGLTAVTSRSIKKEPSPNEPSSKHHNQQQKTPSVPLDSPEDVLSILRDQPDTNVLLEALSKLSATDGFNSFDINSPGPLQAKIINVLVSSTVSTFWPALSSRDRGKLASCLRNIAGIGAVVARLRLLSDLNKASNGPTSELEDLLACLSTMLDGASTVVKVWQGLLHAESSNTPRLQMSWKEIVNVIASGKVIAATAQAEDVLSSREALLQTSWLSDGPNYTAWLSRNIVRLLPSGVDASQAAAQVFTRALSLGYAQVLIKTFVSECLSEDLLPSLEPFFQHLPGFAKRQFVDALLQWLSSKTSSELSPSTMEQERQGKHVSPIAALLLSILEADSSLLQHMIQDLSDPTLSCALSLDVRKACIVAINESAQDNLQDLLEKLQKTFSNQIFIDHAPTLHQQATAQTLLLTAGILHRSDPMAVLMISRSSGHMEGVSNRLHSSNQKARWLGMVVGTAVSSLVDKPGSQMNFDLPEMQTSESRAYYQLVNVKDQPADVAAFKTWLESAATSKPKPKRSHTPPQQLPIINGKQTFGPVRPPVQTEIVGERVTEVLDNDSDEDEDLKPYAKPDSDPEDSDEDATLVNRDRPRPPVYIRDLMRLLRDDKAAARFQLAIKTAPSLIRRKANFGGEVSEHAEELGLMLCDLQDPFDTDDFDELRLQSLIALLMVKPATMAPWLSRQAFVGEYSIAQRCIMLSALGLGGRELAGFKDEYEAQSLALAGSTPSFPSKRLPSRLHAVYNPLSPSTSTKRLEAASKDIEHAIMKPLALSAAVKTTAHLNAVKIRNFSSRMEVERTKRKPAPNQLAKIFREAFFSPLMTRYQQDVAAYGHGSVFSSSPFVLVTFVKTLALLLHASGSATSGLPDITTVFWDLLLSLRTKASSDISILEAVLFSLLTLLEVNGEYGGQQRLAQDNPKHLMETQAWAEVVFERTGAGQLIVEGSGEEVRVRTLAAGVLVKAREDIEAYQKQLMGSAR